MQIHSEMSADSAEQRWPLRDEAEHREQWGWFKARWNAHDEAVRGPLEVRWAQLDREPPFAVVGREGKEESVVVALGREDQHLRFFRAEGGRGLKLRQAARDLGVRTVDIDRAAAAILDGLEQSERVAGRTPVEAPSYEWMDPRRFDRYDEALGDGYLAARASLAEVGINSDAVWQGVKLDLSDERVQHFAVLGRSATSNAAMVLENGDRTEDVMVAVEVLTANPWDRSSRREDVEEELHERLRAVGLRTIWEQTSRVYDSAQVRGIGRAGDQISAAVAASERANAERPAAGEIQQLNKERMARQVPARIRDEDPAIGLRPTGSRLSR